MAVYPSLRGRAVLISGGGAGIGAAMVEAFAWQGAQTLFLELDAAAAEATARRVTGLGLPAPRYRVCDLRDIPASLRAVEQLLEGRAADALINNAGNDQAQPFGEVGVADWDDRVAVNLRHQFFLAQAVAAPMRAAGRGVIVNLGSISWMLGVTGVPVYATLKSAVAGLTKSLARELGGDGIRVNAIAPGWVLTERQLEKGRRDPDKFTRYLERQCLKTHLRPGDVAELALWLCADESAMCTGQTFIVDGGVI
ncbi:MULTISPECIES: SDR family NAD(P)-dependent oxidoreductase [Lysobacter]|jgi:NAD(P)-dependent dehydrogenase (short-subunit alcohol dehydrogenase family)|uniref:SDR family NAD(P)-dependent oxidoreductase n=1 Tax=Lysobacter TaxID=68 RepID=UPI001F1F5C04|nr:MULTISPECIES: SDR family oxidoreductase [Lysobacter]UJB17607.1 SDR family oxidoreductase [Lysobacter capsici]UJQ28671.1 SDR family oxidoreductase [Lysobacter gummosus]